MAPSPRYHVLIGFNHTPKGSGDEVRVEPTVVAGKAGKPVTLAGLSAATRDQFIADGVIELAEAAS